MVFSSVLFLFYFLPLVLVLYFITPIRFRNVLLVLASLFFYAWGEPKYIILMLFSTLVDFGLGNAIWYAHTQENKLLARVFLIASITINLSLLGFFKYSGLVPLPIGISFYTFQTMSYTIDVYRRQVSPQQNLIHFAAYVTLFPQLVAGPIVRYATVERELLSRKPEVDRGILFFVTGLAQKVLIANQMGLIWEELTAGSPASMTLLTSWLGIAAYAFQIYFDFCGYSNMAIGLGLCFGFHFPKNFDKPYTSRSITEFWRRWHISLSSWFREYVYIPLGGNRRGGVFQLRNILIVWVLTGIWHGAGWNFLFWGLYFAVLLILEKSYLLRYLDRLPVFIRHCYSMFFILLGWVLFAFDNLTDIGRWFSSLFGMNGFYDSSFLFYLFNHKVLFLLAVLFSGSFGEKAVRYLQMRLPGKRIINVLKTAWLTALFVLSIAYIVDSTYNPFLYFRF